jgi:hypothetical protein
VKILESPCKTILDNSLSNKTILVYMHQLGDYLLHYICQQFSNQFDGSPSREMGL